MAFMSSLMGFGLLFYLLLGSRWGLWIFASMAENQIGQEMENKMNAQFTSGVAGVAIRR